MAKKITNQQILGELGEAAVRKRFLSFGFQFDSRGRLEAGIDGIAEVMLDGEPQARMIAVQVKTTEQGRYTSETDNGFTFLLKTNDLGYWKNSNIPVIVIFYRRSDDSYYWKDVGTINESQSRRLHVDKAADILDASAVDRLAALTVPKNTPGCYVPPLGGGEDALVNILPIKLPTEMFVTSTPYSANRAISVLHDAGDAPRFDWIIKGGSFWSFHDPREEITRTIVDVDQVEAIDTTYLAFHENADEQNYFAFLLRQTLQHQIRNNIRWDNKKGYFYFMAEEENKPREFYYDSSKNKTSSTVVNVSSNKTDPSRIAFVRHHAFIPKFEQLLDEWYLIITPTYHFTVNGFLPHSYPEALLAGKKRLDNNASLRGQVIMWHRFLTSGASAAGGLFEDKDGETPILAFGDPPVVALPTTVPEKSWGKPKKPASQDNSQQTELWKDAV